ncbi:hypothetical protein [Streptomyces sp. NPDC059452]|uniref:hypothetical protein n=1 Tax=Streptomyces sp. NPDC059452 TaxID=3346835 RepID=UPI0036C15C38
MDTSGTVDQDDIVRAQAILLASGRRTPYEEVDAYRVLAQVSPAPYLPRLVGALLSLSYEPGYGSAPRRGDDSAATARQRQAACLALREEAVVAARAVDPAEPARADLLYQALDSCQKGLYELGRRSEGLALRAEMLAVGRAQAARTGGSAVKGLGVWAAGLSEEGRCGEAADALTELVAAILPDGPREGTLAWSLLEWIGALHEAGRSDEALAAFGTLVDMEAAEAAADRGPMACHLYALIGYARMLGTWGRGDRAAAVRQEAHAVLTELAATGERRSWSGYQTSFWAVLLPLSGADSERPVSGGARPPLGADPGGWSPDVRQRYFDSRTALREEVDALVARAAEDPDGYLAELVRLHRVLTVRSAVYWERRTHLFADRVRGLFDEGVELARRLARHRPAEGTPVLAEALIDRSALWAVTKEFGPALDDFRQAMRCLGEMDEDAD